MKLCALNSLSDVTQKRFSQARKSAVKIFIESLSNSGTLSTKKDLEDSKMPVFTAEFFSLTKTVLEGSVLLGFFHAGRKNENGFC